MKEFGSHPDADHPHHVRHVVLPSGKTIEVVAFDEPGSAAAELHVCPACAGELVYPTRWEEAGRTHWEVALRCPNCEWTGGDVFAQEVVDRFDAELDRGTEALVGDLRRLMRANMEDEVQRFCAALDAGHLLPEDF